MDEALASELKPRFTPPNWAKVFSITLTGDGEIPINKRGSGIRRLILLNFFRAKVEQRAAGRETSSVIYAVEEPETSQHPHNQSMLVRAFLELAEQPDCQVVLTTHTPVLARLLPTSSLQYVSVEENDDRTIYTGDDKTCELITKDLGVLPDHSIKLFIGVEGENDINFLKNISQVLCSSGEGLPDLALFEDKGEIMFVPVGGSNLASWTCRLEGLNRPEFHLFDRNVPPDEESQNQRFVDKINNRPNCFSLLTEKKEMENYLHPAAIKTVRPEVDITFGDFDDVPNLVAKAVHEASNSKIGWDELDEEKKRKKMSKSKVWLNHKAVRSMTPEMLNEIDQNDEVRNWLRKIKVMMSER